MKEITLREFVSSANNRLLIQTMKTASDLRDDPTIGKPLTEMATRLTRMIRSELSQRAALALA